MTYSPRWRIATVCFWMFVAITACEPPPAEPEPTVVPTTPPAVVPEAYVTARDTAANVDSPALWHGPDGQHWLLVTAKGADQVQVFDAATGATVRLVGGPGKALGQFERPNGIAVLDDWVLVVERDNARVQLLRLPAFDPVVTFGETVLERPYGLGVQRLREGVFRLFVTDNYEQAEDVPPPDSLLGRRVHRFLLDATGDPVTVIHEEAFGETSGDGVLHVVESILPDPAHDRLFIAEEDESETTILLYTLAGHYAGATLETRFFESQAEGMVLAGCPDGSGYLIATDQNPARSLFHLFDRATLAHVGSFTGESTANTDGVAFSPQPFGAFREGLFAAVDDDGATAGFDWRAIRQALGLQRCTTAG